MALLTMQAAVAQVTVHVPADFPSIQSGIDAVQGGDTILVAPGTYVENIDFKGKSLVLRSTAGAASTTIDGGRAGPVVRIETGETADAVLEGFTITNGMAPKGAGVLIAGASPTIRGNRIVSNSSIPNQSSWGVGISIELSSSLVEDCEIAYNTSHHGDGGGLGAGPGAVNVTLIRNVIHHNVALGNGGGVYMNNSSVVMVNVTIADNISTANNGGGINCFATLAATNVLLWNNQAPQGQGQQIHVEGGGSATLGYACVEGGYPGTGNVNADPLFAAPMDGDYSLVWPSPCIDAGAPGSPLDPDGTIADIGAIAFEHPNPWSDLESALAGSEGVPSLTGTGKLVAGTLLTLELSSALPFAPCFLVVGVSNLSAPFKGGVLVPYPNLLFGQTVDFFGEASFGGLWPAGIPSGFSFYFQYWIVDAAGPFGFAASNAVAGTTP